MSKGKLYTSAADLKPFDTGKRTKRSRRHPIRI